MKHPEWQGDALAGRRLLVVCEQGLGDNLFALRYAARLAARGESVAVVAPAALRRLLAAQPFLRQVFQLDQPIPRRDYDCWCFAMSLPRLLGEDGSAPAQAPYLACAEPPAPVRGIAVCWAGSPQNPNDVLRSIEPSLLAPLAEVPGVALVSCQHGAERLPAFIQPPPRPIGDLADSAAVLAGADLLISVDSAPAHLAAAMGKEVWMLARWFGDWRWGDAGEASYWYPSLRVLRQPRAGDWQSVIGEARSRLARRGPGG